MPPDVALVIAQAASFLVLNSALLKISIKTGKMFASITVCKEQREELSLRQSRTVEECEDGRYLNLLPVSSRNVRNSPAGFLANRLFGRAEQVEQAVHDGAVQDYLRLHVITGHDVTYSTQGSLHDTRRRVPVPTAGSQSRRQQTEGGTKWTRYIKCWIRTIFQQQTQEAYINNSTSRRQTPASITAWILLLGPSDR